MKAILLIDINDELLEDYDYIYVDYDLRAERKNENYTESIKFVEDCPLKPLPTTKQIENLICKKGYGFMEFEELLDEILGEEE